MPPEKTPLNGTKTHPLSEIALDTLADAASRPVPCQSINPGVFNRLDREDLVEVVDHPSPYASHKGKMIHHVRATEAGRQCLIESGRAVPRRK